MKDFALASSVNWQSILNLIRFISIYRYLNTELVKKLILSSLQAK